MRGHIRKRGSPGTWQVVYDLGAQLAQRCLECDRRFWLERRPLEVCPKCGGKLTDRALTADGRPVIDPETGLPKLLKERRQKCEGGFRTRRDAQDRLTKILHSLQDGGYVEPSKLTLGEYLKDIWLPDQQAAGEIRPTTLASYEVHIVHHLCPGLGTIPLQRLTRETIQRHYNWLAKEGRAPKKPRGFKPKEEPKRKRRRKTKAKPRPAPVVNTALSPTTVRRVHATLHRALKDAVIDNRIPRNPADNVKLPKASKRDQRLYAWTLEQLEAFVDSARGDRLQALWTLYAQTGCRRGELLGLTWDDVAFAAGTITIRRALVPVGYTVTVFEPKTDAGRRTIEVNPSAVATLKRHKAAQDAERMAHRDVWGKDRPEGLEDLNLVFTNEIGRELHPDRVSKLFQAAVAKSGLPRITLHGMRHSHGSVLARANVPIDVIAKRLGHAKSTTTLDFYIHSNGDDDRAAANVFAALAMPESL